MRSALDAGLAGLLGGALLVGVDVGALTDDELVWATQRVQRAVNALEGSRSALVAEAARRELQRRRGDASLADTLAATTSVSGAQARRLERDAVSVATKPGVADALTGGGINSDQAALLAGASVPADVRAVLTDSAAGQTADQTRKAVRAHEAAHRVESDTARLERQCDARFASMWIDHYDGMWNLRAKFDPETGDRIHRGLTRMIQRMWRTDKNLPSAQRPTVAHRSADALARPAHHQRSRPANRERPGTGYHREHPAARHHRGRHGTGHHREHLAARHHRGRHGTGHHREHLAARHHRGRHGTGHHREHLAARHHRGRHGTGHRRGRRGRTTRGGPRRWPWRQHRAGSGIRCLAA